MVSIHIYSAATVSFQIFTTVPYDYNISYYFKPYLSFSYCLAEQRASVLVKKRVNSKRLVLGFVSDIIRSKTRGSLSF